jgi:hypothetical protein
MKLKKQLSYKATMRKADKAFSDFIRNRDTNDGFGYCISCGKLKPYEQLDAGHFVNRRILSLRFDEVNVQIQCRFCNRFNEGNNIDFAQSLRRKYGANILDYLSAAKINHVKYTIFELELIAQKYKDKLKTVNKK